MPGLQLSLRLLTLSCRGRCRRSLTCMLFHGFIDGSLASIPGNCTGQIRPAIAKHHD